MWYNKEIRTFVRVKWQAMLQTVSRMEARMNELLGGRIKALRNARQYTQEQVAEQIGVSRQKYARIENGANTITFELLSKIANVLDVTVEDITGILHETSAVVYRTGSGYNSAEKIFDMLDLFYANKHLYTKIKHNTGI